MRSRAVRLSLTVLATAALAAAAYMWFTLQSRTAAESEAAATFEHARVAALRDASELRAAQQAYVAAGQSETFWFARATAASESLTAALATLEAATTSRAALTSIEKAEAGLEDFQQIDRRARTYTSGGQKLLASDVIFSDGLEAAERIVAALDEAGAAVAADSAAAAAGNTRQQAVIAGGAGAFAILALFLLMPLAAAPAPAVPARELEPVREPGVRRDTGAPDQIAAAAAAARRPAPVAPPEPVTIAPAPSAELQGLAALCTDLARLSDTSLLPGILSRAAAALDASGLVLWITDPDGKELLPIAAHGYPASVLSRMGSLKADDENATAAAFRTGLLQTVSAGEGSNGAIAVPLVTPAGCRGVMSAEVRHDGEKQPARLAAASIVAAQLATLVGPPPVSAQDRDSAAV